MAKVLYRSAGVDVYYDDGIYTVLGPVSGNPWFTVSDNSGGDVFRAKTADACVTRAKSLRTDRSYPGRAIVSAELGGSLRIRVRYHSIAQRMQLAQFACPAHPSIRTPRRLATKLYAIESALAIRSP